MLIIIVYSWAFLQLDCKPFRERLSLHSLISKSLTLKSTVHVHKQGRHSCLQTYFLPKHSEEKVHEDSVFARVLLTQSIDGLHHYHLQEKGASKKQFCFIMQEKIAQLYQFCAGLPSLEIMFLSLFIQQMQLQGVQS